MLMNFKEGANYVERKVGDAFGITDFRESRKRGENKFDAVAALIFQMGEPLSEPLYKNESIDEVLSFFDSAVDGLVLVSVIASMENPAFLLPVAGKLIYNAAVSAVKDIKIPVARKNN